MTKKTVLISGATSGIGRATALAMCERNFKLIILGRTQDKIAETQMWLKEQCKDAEVFGFAVDFSDLNSVNQTVAQIKQAHSIIDVVINNAGAIHMEAEKSAEGLEKTLVVNYYSHFILTMGLLDNVKAAKDGRVISVSSDCYKLPGYAFDEKIEDAKYNWNRAYNRSKLAQVQFTYKLQQELSDSSVTVACVSPGGVKTKIYDPMPKFVRWLTALSLKPVEKGVKDIVDLASQDDVEQYKGTFVSGGKIKSVPNRFLQVDLLNKLWQQSKSLLLEPKTAAVS